MGKHTKLALRLVLFALLPVMVFGWFFKEVWEVCTRPIASLNVCEAAVFIFLLAYPLRKVLSWMDRLDR